ncbi:unnamed protein product [Cuscuta epithymum]|uniref:Uncharacterized protein n=2 Tax=Cuscuta epithymum TaxID=186058 RepID=A0AAV0CNM8_9ASTE|nr:unnamed protein product [Cuscuta epithymum]
MSGISQKKRSSISRIIHTAKQPKMTATSIPKLPQMSNVDKGSSLVFDPLSLRYSVNNRRCQAPSPHSDQPPKEFHHVPAVKVHQTKIAPTPSVTGMSKPDKITLWNTKVGSKSTEGSFQSSSEKERAQPTINARRSVFAGGVSSSHKRQNPPSDLVDDVQVHHNREKERKESQEEYTTDKSTQRSFSDEHEIENDAREFSQTEDDSRGRGPCKQIKTSRMVRLSKHRIEVSYNKVTERATSAEIHSLLVHDVGAIVRSHCPMDTGFWGKIPLKDREDLMGEITVR